jgi:hypothetical protein
MKCSGATIFRILLALLFGVICFYTGHRTGSKESFLEEKRRGNEPEHGLLQSAEWMEPREEEPTPKKPATSPSTEQVIEAAEISESVVAETAEPATDTFPIVLDAAQPVRISWPLDIGPDTNPGRKDSRVCLRARGGVNEIQEQGEGWALYAFQISRPGKYQAFCRSRWTTDGLSVVACNNSWFVRFDDQPSCMIGNENDNSTNWQWVDGPTAELEAGLHWLRVELREDGPLMDRIAVVPVGEKPVPEWGAVQAVRLNNLGGEANPLEPQKAIRAIEFFALPTGSLAIGNGHVNEITIGASWFGAAGGSLTGKIMIACPSAPGLTVTGDSGLNVNLDQTFVSRQLTLKFPTDADRRIHEVILEIKEQDGSPVFRTQIKFQKGNAWAFLGPFKDLSKRSKKVYRGTGSLRELEQTCDSSPAKIAQLASSEDLELDSLLLASGFDKAKWKIVEDGSCYDWTGAIDLLKVYGPVDSAFAYAVTWIQAETALNHRSFNFQPDDSGWLWVNGHILAELPIDLPREANRLWTSAKLKRGQNPVVVKLAQNQRYWGFRFDVIDWHWQGRRGDVIRGIPVADWPTK